MISENNINEHELLIDNSTIHYRSLGNPKKQLIIFLHGWPGIYLEESGVLQELAKYFYVISPEHPGLLRSDPLNKYENIFDQYSDVVRKILQKEKFETKKAIVMGQSFGGGIASHYANKYPEYTKTLILTDSIIGAGNIAPYVHFLFNFGPKLLKLACYLPTSIQRRVAFDVFGIPASKFSNKSILNRLTMVNNYTGLIKKACASNRMIIDKPYGNFRILFVWGDRDGKEFNLYGSCNVDDARNLSAKLKQLGKNISFITINGGHTILYEKPQYVINKIIENLTIK